MPTQIGLLWELLSGGTPAPDYVGRRGEQMQQMAKLKLLMAQGETNLAASQLKLEDDEVSRQADIESASAKYGHLPPGHARAKMLSDLRDAERARTVEKHGLESELTKSTTKFNLARPDIEAAKQTAAMERVKAAMEGRINAIEETARHRPPPTIMPYPVNIPGMGPALINRRGGGILGGMKPMPSAADVKGSIESTAESVAIKDVVDLYDPSFVGPGFAGLLGTAGQKRIFAERGISKTTPEQSTFYSMLDRANTAYRHKMFGSAFTQTERGLMAGQLPDINQPPDIFKARLNAMARNSDILDRIYEARMSGQIPQDAKIKPILRHNPDGTYDIEDFTIELGASANPGTPPPGGAELESRLRKKYGLP
jgi:hypothetical protein